MAKGSHATYSEDKWEIRQCFHCGAKITLKTGGFFHYPQNGEPWSSCIRCVRKKPPR